MIVDVLADAPSIRVALSTFLAVLDTVRVTAARLLDPRYTGFLDRSRVVSPRVVSPRASAVSAWTSAVEKLSCAAMWEKRTSACIIGGTSGNASLTAIWLKPQLKHSISTKAMAPGLPTLGISAAVDFLISVFRAVIACVR